MLSVALFFDGDFNVVIERLGSGSLREAPAPYPISIKYIINIEKVA